MCKGVLAPTLGSELADRKPLPPSKKPGARSSSAGDTSLLKHSCSLLDWKKALSSLTLAKLARAYVPMSKMFRVLLGPLALYRP